VFFLEMPAVHESKAQAAMDWWVGQWAFGSLIWSFTVVAVMVILEVRSGAKKMRKMKANEEVLATSNHSKCQDNLDFEEGEIEGQDQTIRSFWGMGPCEAVALVYLIILIVFFC
jgi:hypothetical protein